jgi:hypothetical protein
MDEQELSKVSELSNRNIRTSCGLKTFHTADTNTNMRSLNHGHVVGTITNCQKNGLLVALDKLDDQSLLKGRYSTADDRFAHHSEI